MTHAQKKGKAGEVEFCKWLDKNLDLSTERNYNQADGSSADVEVGPFLFEVKRREVLDLYAWWCQVKNASKNNNNVPVVAFRQNRKPWEFLIPAKFICDSDSYIRMSERVFVSFAKEYMVRNEYC